MDSKLLNALNNIGDALDALVEALADKTSAKSDAGAALQTGDFGKQLESISKDIKSIKADTQEILKQQKTIISQANESEKKSKLGILDSIGSDGSMMENITKGIGVIVLIAGAVLAIGLAFKVVGNVDFISVISLGLAIVMISIAFKEISDLNMSIEQVLIASAGITLISIALMISSWFLSKITTIGLGQLITAGLISGMFALIAPSMGKMIKSFGDVGWMTLLKAVVFLPLVLPAIALGIALSSKFLGATESITFGQFISIVLIGAAFAVIAFGMKNILSAFKGIKPEDAALAVITIPLLFTAMSAAIMYSSWFLSSVMPVGIFQLLTSLAIGLIFIPLGFAAGAILSSANKMDIDNIWKIPLLMITMSVAITASSYILNEAVDIDFVRLLKIGLLGGILAGISVLMLPAIVALGKQPIQTILMGGLAIVVVATAVMASSWILSLGNYEDNYPSITWTLSVAAAMLPFGLAMSVLGGIAMSGLGAVALLLGGVMVLAVAGTVMATSHILKMGDYSTYPGLDWAMGVSVSLGAFALGMTTLGALIFATFGIGGAMLAAGSGAVLMVAKTIVAASNILANGYTDEDGKLMRPNYVGGPTEDWAKGVSLALGAFSPVYGMLMKNAILSFLGGGVGPDDFAEAIKTVSKGIVTAAHELNQSDELWKGGPTKDWAEGVSLAIGAFSPLYEILAANSGWFSSGVSVDDFDGAIQTISKGIITAAKELNQSDELWKGGPTKDWAEGVSLAIGAFAPVYEILADNSGWLSSGVSIDDFVKAIKTISRGIVSAAEFFSENTAPFEEGKYPSKEWGEGVGTALGAFSPVFDMLMEKSGFWKSGDSVINDMIKGITGISSAIVRVATMFTLASKVDIFKAYPSLDWGDNVRENIELFTEISKYIEQQDVKYGNVQRVVNRISGVARTLFNNSDLFSVSIDPNYIKNISSNILDFSELAKKLVDSEDTGGSMLSRIGQSLTGSDPISQIAKRMVTLAGGYDKLANSLMKLGTAMQMLNISDVSKLGGLTRSLIIPSERSDIKESLIGGSPTIQTGDTSLFENFFNKKEDVDGDINEDPIASRLDQVITLLTSINSNTVNINEFIELQSEGEIEAPTDLQN